MTTRREFLKFSTIISAGALISGNAANAFPGPKPGHVIVVGAGFAGLAAAHYLRKKNIKVTVLEASNRICGRVFSLDIPDEKLVIELGGEWVGASHERIIKLCDQYGLELMNNQFETHLVYKGEYSPKNKWDFSEGWKTKWKKLLENYAHLTDAQKKQLDTYDWWRYLVNNGCDGRDLDLRELLDSTDFGESIRHISAFAALAEYAESSEKNEMDFKIKGGNARLGHKLAEVIGKENILLDHAATRIDQQAGKVKVICANGKSFTADKLICTLPTFAMKKIEWLPGLPIEKRNAMNALQYARINKHPVLFNQRFWPEDFDMVTDLPAHYFYNATKNQPGNKGVLISYTIGDKAAVAANQGDAFHKGIISQALQPAFGSVEDKMLKHYNFYWGNNEATRGAYAMYGINQWFTLRPILQKPFMHTHFAGEHIADWQGFMEGAINTGEDAAAAIA